MRKINFKITLLSATALIAIPAPVLALTLKQEQLRHTMFNGMILLTVMIGALTYFRFKR